MLRKITVLALLFALVLAAFPTDSVFAGSPVADKLEKKWDQLIDRFETQNAHHALAHKWVENFYKTHKDAPASQKAEMEKHLAICNSSLASAQALISSHPGFDAEGNAVDYVAAKTTLDQLANYLQQHTGSVKNLLAHANE